MILRIDTEKEILTVQGWTTVEEQKEITEKLNDYFCKNKWKELKLRFKTRETKQFKQEVKR